MKKIFLITGGTNGIGFHTAQEIAKLDSTIIITGKNMAKGKRKLELIKSNTKNEDIHYINGDLSSLSEVKRMAESIERKFSSINVLINNAGIGYFNRVESVDCIEKTFATNHLGHFLLTGLLLPILKISNQPRIINLSSEGHKKCNNI